MGKAWRPRKLWVSVALLGTAVALTPLAIRFTEQAKAARALADSRRLGRAILAFHLDTAVWPVRTEGGGGAISRLVGLPVAEIRPGGVPLGAGSARGWRGGGDGGIAGSIEDHLVTNRSAGLDPIYRTSATAPDPPGWRGPYLSSVPVDPWDRPFVCNTRYLDGAGVPGVTVVETDRHAVLCLSAGPNGRFDTPFDDAVPLVRPGGDDIGWPIQAGLAR